MGPGQWAFAALVFLYFLFTGQEVLATQMQEASTREHTTRADRLPSPSSQALGVEPSAPESEDIITVIENFIKDAVKDAVNEVKNIALGTILVWAAPSMAMQNELKGIEQRAVPVSEVNMEWERGVPCC